MKTVTKKFFAMLLAAVMLFSAVPFGAAAAGNGETRTFGKKRVTLEIVQTDAVAEVIKKTVDAPAEINMSWVNEQVAAFVDHDVVVMDAQILNVVFGEDYNLMTRPGYVPDKSVTVQVIVNNAPETPVDPEPEPDPVDPVVTMLNATIIEGSKTTRHLKIKVTDGMMDVLALLSEQGYAVAEYTVVVDDFTYDAGELNAVPAPAGKSTVIELKAEDVAVPEASKKLTAVVKESGAKDKTFEIAVAGGKMDVLALLSENGYAVAEYTVKVDGTKYDLGELSAVPAPSHKNTITIELKTVNAVPVAKKLTAIVKESGAKDKTFEIAVAGGKMDVLALLSENGYAVAEYTVKVDGTKYDLGELSAVPAPSHKNTTTIELVTENTAESSRPPYNPDRDHDSDRDHGNVTVTFLAGEGSWGRGKSELNVTVRKGQSLGRLMPENPTCKGKEFAGWKYANSNFDFDKNSKVTEDTVVEADWAGRRETFTITFDPTEGSLGRHEKTMEVHYKEVLKHMPVPTHRSLEFQGWFDEHDNKWEDGDIYNRAQDMTLTAKWARSAKVTLHIYMDGNTKKSAFDVKLDGYSVGDFITLKHVKRDVWDCGIEAKSGKQLEYDGLFDADSWNHYVRTGRGGKNEIEIENHRQNDIYVMVFNGQTHHRPWDPTNPKTGDEMMLEGAIAVMALAAVGFVTLTTLRKKKVL